MFLKSFSSPVVVGVGGSNSLELPEISRVKLHRFWISSSKSLSNIGITKSLSIAPLEVAKSESENGSKGKSAHTLVNIDVVVVWHSGSLSKEILN